MPKTALTNKPYFYDISDALMEHVERIAGEHGITVTEALQLVIEYGIAAIDNVI